MADNIQRGSADRARVAGSGFTVFTWAAQPILYARQISHQSQPPVAQPVAIHPMDAPYAVEIVTPQAAGPGTIVLELYELYGQDVWERLSGLGKANGRGPVDIVGIFKAVADTPNPIRVFKFIKPPSIRGRKMTPYTVEYHNVIVSGVEEGETIQVGTMEVLKQLQLQYTHTTKGGRNDVLTNTSLGNGARDATAAPPNSYR